MGSSHLRQFPYSPSSIRFSAAVILVSFDWRWATTGYGAAGLAMALAVASRRAGNLAEADAQYRILLQQESANHASANNAANLKFELGESESAIALYRKSLEMKNSATVLFNLSQVQGQAFKLDDVGPTLAAAQQFDPARIAELTLLQGSDLAGFTVDLPLPRRMLWERILASRSGESFA